MSQFLDPHYYWYEDADAFGSDSPTRVSSGESFFNQVQGGTFRLHRHGGCLDGELKCPPSLPSIIRPGWFFRARLAEDGEYFFSGRVLSISRRGDSHIKVVGLLRDIDGSLEGIERQSIEGESAPEAMKILVRKAIQESIGQFWRPQGVLSGFFGDTRTQTPFPIHYAPNAQNRLSRMLMDIAISAGNMWYGFFPKNTNLYGTDDYPDDFFQIVQGGPPRRRRYIPVEGDLQQQEDTSSIVNDVTLYGTYQGSIWRGSDDYSVRQYGRQKRWIHKSDIENPFVYLTQGEGALRNNFLPAASIISSILRELSSPIKSFSVRVRHVDEDGDPFNLIQTRLITPWSERLVVMDESGAFMLTDDPINAVTIEIGASLELDVEISNKPPDIKKMFSLDKISDSPPDFIPEAAPYISTGGVMAPPDRNIKAPGIAEPPIAFMMPQGRGDFGNSMNVPYNTNWAYLVRHKFLERDDGSEISEEERKSLVEDTDFPNASARISTRDMIKHIPYNKVMEFLRWGNISTPVYYNLSGQVERLVRHLPEKDINTSSVRGFDNREAENWGRLVRGSDEFYVRNPDKFNAETLAADWRLKPYFDISEYLPVYWDEGASNENKIGITQIDSGNPIWRGDGILKGIPWQLLLHLGYAIGEKIDPNMDNYDAVKNLYIDQIYTIPVRREPYLLEDVTPSDGLSPDYENRVWYFTPDGIEGAVTRGYFWSLEAKLDYVTSSQLYEGVLYAWLESQFPDRSYGYQNPLSVGVKNPNSLIAQWEDNVWRSLTDSGKSSQEGLESIGGVLFPKAPFSLRITKTKRFFSSHSKVPDYAFYNFDPSGVSTSLQSRGVLRMETIREYRVTGYDDDPESNY